MTGRGVASTRRLFCCRCSSLAPVLGLALLLWFNALGINPSWQTAVVAHLVWIVPVVTLVIAIQVYSFDPTLEEAARDLGASRWFILREVTLPILWPGIWSGALFAFLLSWGNFPLSLYTAGVDSTIPKWIGLNLQEARRLREEAEVLPGAPAGQCAVRG